MNKKISPTLIGAFVIGAIALLVIAIILEILLRALVAPLVLIASVILSFL